MVTHDRIRLTGLLPKSPACAGLFYSSRLLKDLVQPLGELLQITGSHRS
jgi:hypothetical protein